MATTVGSHSVSTFATPVNGGPLDANVVRGNDNTIRTAYVAHDADTGIHVQSSTLASRPSAGTAGRKWITADTGSFKLWYDDGTTWHEVGTATIDVYVLADETLAKGDVIKVTGYNVGNGAPRVAKISSASDVAFGVVNGAIASGAVGYVTNTGLIADVATNSFSIGDILYPNTSGGFTATKPTSGNYQPVAYVLRSNLNNGVLYVEFSAPRIVERSDNTASTVVLRDASGNFSAGTITAGALTSTGLVTFASLKGTGATTVTDILNDSTMATASATTLATSSSIKTYVDNKVATVDTLAEVLANGNTTGANNIIVSSGQKITTNTIDETTSGSGVTIDSVLLKDDVVNATDIETGTISANDGTTSATIANSTGVMTIASSVLTTTDINGGTVDGVTIGGASAGAATFTNVTANGTINLTGATVSNGGSVTTIDINGGTIDGTTIGGASAAAGTFTTINATTINATTFDMTNLEVTNIKAKDGTAAMTIADTTGNVAVSTAFAANGNVTLGDATSDTITVGGSFPTGTKLRTAQSVGNTLAVSAYDVDGTAYVDLITATASNTPTLALTSTGTGSMNNIAIGGSTPAAGAFTTLDASGDFAVATNKFTVASASGNTAVAGTLTTEGTLTSNGNTVLGNAATDTITATAQFVTGTQLKSAQSSGNTLALAAYDVDGTAYTSLVILTAGNTPTLTMTSVGTGSLNNVTIGGSTAAAGTFTNLTAQTDLTIGTDVVLSRGAANRLDLASGDSLNVVSGDYQIAGSSVLNATTLGSGVTASSLTSVGTLTSLTVSAAGNPVSLNNSSAAGLNGMIEGKRGGTARYYIGWDASDNFAILNNTASSAILTLTNGGNLTIPGDLTVDTSTLKVDSTNNRVGIGTASPAYTLHAVKATSGDVAQFTNGGASNKSGYIYTDNQYVALSTGTLTQGVSLLMDATNSKMNFQINSSILAILDASGNLGLGVTPSAWTSPFVAQQIGSGIGSLVLAGRSDSGADMFIGRNVYYGGSPADFRYIGTGTATRYRCDGATHAWSYAASGTAGNAITFTQAMTLDASGNLGVGTTATAGVRLHTYVAAAIAEHRIECSDTSGVFSRWKSSAGDIGYFGQANVFIGGASSSNLAIASATGAITFGTGSTIAERARITAGGYFKASDAGTYANATGNYHELRGSASGDNAVVIANTASSQPNAMYVRLSGASPDNNTQHFAYFDDSTTLRCVIYSDGDIQNHDGVYGTISDERLKQDIVDAGSAWDDLKAVRFRKFRMKSDVEANPDAPAMLGVIAQEIEQVMPGLVDEHPEFENREIVDEDGNVTTERVQVRITKSVKQSILLMKAAVALQEAMARIEALEASNAGLKARLEALEA